MSELVLITGATGKTGRRLVKAFEAQGLAFRAASRSSAEGRASSPFDWRNAETWGNALQGVSSVYLVGAPLGGGSPDRMIEFATAAVQAGVRRLVLLSASLVEAGGPSFGQVHLWLKDNAPEWAVLRPSWFMENFTEAFHALTIRDESAIYTATGDGRVAFISADDIAQSAFAALTAVRPSNTDFVLTGPRAISYDEVAYLIGRVSGREIVHHSIPPEELAARHMARGMPEAGARALAAMDAAISAGAENRVTDAVGRLTGRTPKPFEAFLFENANGFRAPLA